MIALDRLTRHTAPRPRQWARVIMDEDSVVAFQITEHLVVLRVIAKGDHVFYGPDTLALEVAMWYTAQGHKVSVHQNEHS